MNPKESCKKPKEETGSGTAHRCSACLGDGEPAWSRHPQYSVTASIAITQQTNCAGGQGYGRGCQLAAKAATNSRPITKLSAGWDKHPRSTSSLLPWAGSDY